MFIHSKNHLTDLDEACIQPNACDLRIDTVARYIGNFMLTDGKTYHRETEHLVPQVDGDGSQYWSLNQGSYQFYVKHMVKMPENTIGWLVPRSSLNRNGIRITSALYDSGYQGSINGCLHVLTPGITTIYRNARVSQFIMAKAEMVKLYDGQYQGT